MRIALIGTRGVPARYGGFETAVEEIGSRLADAGHRVTVYARERGPAEYRGMRVKYLPTVRTKYTDTLAHSFLSVGHALLARPDAAIVFNAANAPPATLLRLTGIPYALHVDGLEWRRAKWSGVGRTYYLMAERLAVRTANALIADSRGISEYYADRYGVETELIAYGAPIKDLDERVGQRLSELDLGVGRYHLVVARLEPENHVLEIVKGFSLSNARFPLIVAGSAAYGDQYRRQLEELAAEDPRVRLIGPVWDQELLDSLYLGCATYLHGHSVGGTNPSLLRASGAGAPVVAFDVPFNREVIGADGLYFRTPGELPPLIEDAERRHEEHRLRGCRLRESILARYNWDEVAAAYEALCDRLVVHGLVRAQQTNEAT
jgi:glycosyltransferase involved in cell wall biosynthesis